MATAFGPSGQSPTSLSKTLEKVLEDAQHTGEINLAGRKLKEYPKIASKYDLVDTITTDLSKNRFVEVPVTVCEYHSLEILSCYNNVIKSIPEALVQLQALVHLNLSRNQLSNIPPFICQLHNLEILLAANNRLVSLPEEISRLERLMDLDVSCNEISHLPKQMGDLESLKRLNVRRNRLVELPLELSQLKLERIDISGNKISHLPCDFHKIDTIKEVVLDHNPLVSPPANICTKGRVHIIKFLHSEAIKEDQRRGILNDVEMKSNIRKTPLPVSNSNEFKYLESPTDHRKRLTVDSGYSTTDSSTDKSRWSPSEVNYDREAATASMLAVRAAVNEQQSPTMEELDKRALTAVSNTQIHGKPAALQQMQSNIPPPFPDIQSFEPHVDRVDEFTRELHRQKTEYEAKKKVAERIRREVEEEEDKEREERRRTSMRIQEEQKAIMAQHKEEARKRGDKRIPQSHSFKEEKRVNHNNYRRTVSESTFNNDGIQGRDVKAYPLSRNGIHESFSRPEVNSQMSPVSPMNQTTPQYSPLPQDDEFRLRHEAMLCQQRHEANMVRKQLEEERRRLQLEEERQRLLLEEERHRLQQQSPNGDDKDRIKVMQKEALFGYISKRTHGGRSSGSESEESSFSCNRDSAPNIYYNNSSSPVPVNSQDKLRQGLPLGVQKGLEAMSQELNSMNPAFTIRRQLQHAQEEMAQMEQLRKNIEDRLKVTLPDDLPAALKDGVVLCHLANHVRPRSVSSIHVPSPAVPKLTMAKCRRNVENFLEACRRIGVDQKHLCPASSVLEEKGTLHLALTVQSLLKSASAPKLSAV